MAIDQKTSKPSEDWFSKAQMSKLSFELDQLTHQVRSDPGASDEARRLSELALMFFGFIDQVVSAFDDKGATAPHHLFELADVLNKSVNRKGINVLDITKAIDQYEQKKDYTKRYNALIGKVRVLLPYLAAQRNELDELAEKLKEVRQDSDLMDLAIHGIEEAVSQGVKES